MPYAGHAYDMVGAGYTMMANVDYKPNEIMNKFKVGDKVWYKGGRIDGTGSKYPRCEVEIVSTHGGTMAKFPDGGAWWISERDIEQPSPTSAFKAGDRVRCTYGWADGKVATVISVQGKGRGEWVNVRVDEFKGYCSDTDTHSFYPDHLQLLSPLLSPPSPQPQTTEPKEDTMKPYAVIYHNLTQSASGAQIQSHHTTEEEAKESAEALVAAQRSEQVKKNYFAVTIVNTKTGKLVGSVVDAPPAVDWKTE